MGSGPEVPCQSADQTSVQAVSSAVYLCSHGCVLLAALRCVLAGVRRGAWADVWLREGLGLCDGVHCARAVLGRAMLECSSVRSWQQDGWQAVAAVCCVLVGVRRGRVCDGSKRW